MSGEGSVTLSQNGVPMKGALTVAVSGDRHPARRRRRLPGKRSFSLSSSAGTSTTLLDFKNRTVSNAGQPKRRRPGRRRASMASRRRSSLDLFLARLPCAGDARKRERAENTVHLARCFGAEAHGELPARRKTPPGYYLN